MEITKKRDIYRMIAAGGFLFYAVFRYLSMISSDWYKDSRYSLLKEDLKVVMCFYVSIGVIILLSSGKAFLNYIWLASLAFADVLVLGLRGDFPVIRLSLYFLTAAVMILNLRMFRGKTATIVTRFGWLILCLLYGSVIAHTFFNMGGFTYTQLAFYSAAVFMVLYTMAMTLVPLKIFSGFVSKLFFVPALCALYGLFFPASHSAATGMTVRFLAMVPLLNEAVSCSAYCLYLTYILKHKKDLRFSLADKRLYMALPVIFLIAVIFTGNYLKLSNRDPGIRREKAVQTYRVLIYQNEDYNWYDIYDEKSLVKTKDLKSSIVLLSDDSMPVMFLSGGMVSEADGMTRLLIYDEDKGKAKAVLGAWHSITIDGYCKADEDHRYPVIYCHGGHMGLVNELIYELRGNRPVLIGEAKINDAAETGFPDEYTWNEQTVSKEEYSAKRDQVLKGYQEIEWNDYWL